MINRKYLYYVFHILKEEQEEILKIRPASQKRLSLNEVKQMIYLSYVSILENDIYSSFTYVRLRQQRNETIFLLAGNR